MIALFLLAALSVALPVPSFAEGLYAAEDNFIAGGNGGAVERTVQDDSTFLQAERTAPGQDGRKIYLKFDASQLEGRIESVGKLSLRYSGRISRPFEVYLLEGPGVDEWSEATLTWENAPLNDRSGALFSPGDEGKVTLLGSASTIGKSSYMDVEFGPGRSDLAEALNTGDRVATLAIVATGSDSVAFISKDYQYGSLTPFLQYTPAR
jgi:hypothetical protein